LGSDPPSGIEHVILSAVNVATIPATLRAVAM
jgi:hypothetical protein